VYVCPVGLGAGRVSVSWYLLIGSIPTASEMQRDSMDPRTVRSSEMEAGHDRPTQFIAERTARLFISINLRKFIVLDRKSKWRSKECSWKQQTRKPW
jgi:hypothetical protein